MTDSSENRPQPIRGQRPERGTTQGWGKGVNEEATEVLRETEGGTERNWDTVRG